MTRWMAVCGSSAIWSFSARYDFMVWEDGEDKIEHNLLIEQQVRVSHTWGPALNVIMHLCGWMTTFPKSLKPFLLILNCQYT